MLLRCNSFSVWGQHLKNSMTIELWIVKSTWTSITFIKKPLNYSNDSAGNDSHSTPGCNQATLKRSNILHRTPTHPLCFIAKLCHLCIVINTSLQKWCFEGRSPVTWVMMLRFCAHGFIDSGFNEPHSVSILYDLVVFYLVPFENCIIIQ